MVRTILRRTCHVVWHGRRARRTQPNARADTRGRTHRMAFLPDVRKPREEPGRQRIVGGLVYSVSEHKNRIEGGRRDGMQRHKSGTFAHKQTDLAHNDYAPTRQRKPRPIVRESQPPGRYFCPCRGSTRQGQCRCRWTPLGQARACWTCWPPGRYASSHRPTCRRPAVGRDHFK